MQARFFVLPGCLLISMLFPWGAASGADAASAADLANSGFSAMSDAELMSADARFGDPEELKAQVDHVEGSKVFSDNSPPSSSAVTVGAQSLAPAFRPEQFGKRYIEKTVPSY